MDEPRKIRTAREEANFLLQVLDSRQLDPASPEYQAIRAEYERLDKICMDWAKMYQEGEIEKTRIQVEADTAKKERIKDYVITGVNAVVKVSCTAGAVFATLVACGLDEDKVASKSALSVADKFTKNIL